MTGAAPVRLAARLDRDDGAAGIGAIAPFDFRADRDCWRYLEAIEGASLHLARTPPVPGPVSLALARAVGDRAAVLAAAASLLPVTGHLAYLCTSGTFVAGRAGEAALREAVLSAGATSFVTTSEALVLAARALGVERLALLAPYDGELTAALVAYLEEGGLEVVAAGCLGLEAEIHRLGSGELRRLVPAVDHPRAEAVLVSCTNLSTFDVVAGLERRLGKPVVTANQATIWAALAAAGRLGEAKVDHRLFAHRPPGAAGAVPA